MELKKLRSSLQHTVAVMDNEVVVYGRCAKKHSNIYFACYLVANGDVVSKQLYQKSGQFNFTINKTGKYIARLYVYDKTSGLKTHKYIDFGMIFCESSYYKSNVENFKISDNKKSGELLFKSKTLSFPKFNDVVLSDFEGIYELDPYGNRTWRWLLLQMQHLIYLLNYAHENTDKIEILNCAIEFFKDWCVYKESEVAKNDQMLWQDHVTALRLHNFTFMFSYLTNYKIILEGDELYDLFLKNIKEHIDILSKDSFYSKHTNHGFDQSIFLYQAVLELEYILDVKEIILLAEKRILDEINFAFCKDGGHKENSPAYLNFGIKQCLLALNLERKYKGSIEKFGFVNDIVDSATEVLFHTIKPDGLLPMIGDTSYYRATNIFSSYKPKAYDNFNYAISEGKRGTKPLKLYHVLPETGYAFYRSHWNKQNFKDAVYLSFKAGYKSNYHRHDDDLSITLYGYGEDWLIDGGIYKYDNSNLHRKYIRSHKSHNIFSPILGVSKREIMSGKPHAACLSHIYDERTSHLTFFGKSEMFRGFNNSRKIEIHGEKICLADKLVNLKGEPFEAVLRFFINKDKVIRIEKTKIIIIGKKKGLNIEILSKENFKIRIVNKPKDQIEGWLSPKNGVIEQVNLVEVVYSGNGLDIIDSCAVLNFVDIIKA